MSIALSYDATLARVRISATSLPTIADVALFERSTNGIQWTAVRGGQAVPIVAGEASLDDYEFIPGVSNLYRVAAVDTDTTTHVGVGTSSVSQNTAGVSTVTPGLPVGWEVGDLHLLLASIRNSGTGTVNTPTGWTALVTSGNFALFGRRAEAGDTAPVVTFSGGVAGASILAQIYGRRNAELQPVATAQQLNGSGQNIPHPAITGNTASGVVIVAGWKQDDWTSVDTLAGMTENAEMVETGGDDAGMVWDRYVSDIPLSAGSFVVTGGGAAISRAIVAAFRPADFVTREQDSITPTINTVWLKSIARPFLNRPVTVVDVSEISRPARSGVFDVVGRSYPVAVSDVRGSRRYSITVCTDTLADAEAVDLILASGDPLYIQVPAGWNIPGGYVVVGDTTETRFPGQPADDPRLFELPMTQVAPPGADVVGTTAEWQSIIDGFGTWTDVLAEFPTWADVLDYVADPSTVIVP